MADVDPKEVLGIGFDATCSLVLLDDKFNPVAASVSGMHVQSLEYVL